MRLTEWRRQPWRADLAFFLTLCLLFLPAWAGLRPNNEPKVMAQGPAPGASRPILVIPLQPGENVPANVAEGVTFALVEELEMSRQFSPTRLSLDEPTIQRLVREGQLIEETVMEVLQRPTPEGIAQIASAMKCADAVYGTVDSYTYDPQANGGSVKVKVTAHFLKIDLATGALTETKEISKEGSSIPKLAPRPEKELAAEAFRNATRQIVDELLGRPPTVRPVREVKKPTIGALPALLGLLVLGAIIGGARRGDDVGPAPTGPANAPSRVSAFPQGSLIVVSWQPPTQGSPIGYNVYRADAGLASRQADSFQRLNPTPIPVTQYQDTQVVVGRVYLYAVTAVYPNNVESPRVFANADITGQPVPIGIGVPLPPRNLQAQPGDGSVRLTWEDSNPSGFVRGYRVYRQRGAPPTDADLIADETIVRTPTFTDRGLINGTTYFYVVRAVSTQGYLSAPSAVVTATPGNLPPQAPLLSGQFNPVNLTVTLSWTPPPDPDIAYYEVARIVETIQRSRLLNTRAVRQTPTVNLPPGVARRVFQTNPRLRQAGSPFDNNIIATQITVTSFQDSVIQFRPSGQALTTYYYVLRYAVRAVDQSGTKGAWSNVIEITPNSPPPSLSAVRPRLTPGNRQVIVDLRPLLDAAAGDPEWQIDQRGVRIFRSTTKGGTQSPALTPIHSVDPLPLDQLDQGRYFRDSQVFNGTRYFYAVELVDKLGVAGGRSQETAATPFSSASITIQSNRTELSGNGQDSAQLTISVVDATNRPVAGLSLLVSLVGQGTLTVDPAYRDPQVVDGAITDENGQVIATYQAPIVTADTTVTITASPGVGVSGVSPASLTLTVRVPRVASVEVRPQKTQLTADGLDVTDVTIIVRDTLGRPVPNKVVSLSISPADPTLAGRFEDLLGNPIAQTTTASDGTARVRYRAGKRAGSVTLQGSVTEGLTTIFGQAVVTLVAGAPARIELVANPSSAPADGSTEVRVTATVRDAQGNAVPRVQVLFSATPTLTITPTVATTDDTGQATVSVIAPNRAGSYTLQARVGTIVGTITLVFVAGPPSTLTMSASRTDLLVSLPPRFGSSDYSDLAPFSKAEITVTVLDANNNPVPNVVVRFSATAGTIQSTALTNDAGIAKAPYVAPILVPAGGQVTINAQAGAASSSLQLTILPGPPAKVRIIRADPLSLPADGRSQSQVEVEVYDANDNLVADGTNVEFSARNPSNLNQSMNAAGQFLQSQVPTLNGVATAIFIAGTQPSVSAVLVAQAFGTVFGRTFGPIPAEDELASLYLRGELPTIRLVPPP